jgi:ferredoxin-NADP reductase/ferredoxin
MTSIHYDQNRFELGENQSVLECLTENGVFVPSSCRVGVCQTCLMRATDGIPPAASQTGLKDGLILQNFFLACICHPTEDISVALPDELLPSTQAVVRKLELLNPEIMFVELACESPVDYRAGQFINLIHDSGHVRSYSIASVARLDNSIQLHVRRLPQGRVSGWIHDDLQQGHRIEFHGPVGDCFYTPGNPKQDLLLIGTGTGLAPLYGITRDALDQGHSGSIRLFHGSRDLQGLYLIDELRELERRFANFSYFPCLSGSGMEVPAGFFAGRAHETAFRETPNLKDYRVFLCGHPEMVKAAQKKAYLAGASMQDIHIDAFSFGHSS